MAVYKQTQKQKQKGKVKGMNDARLFFDFSKLCLFDNKIVILCFFFDIIIFPMKLNFITDKF